VVTRAGVTEEDLREVFPTFAACYRAAFEEGLGRLSGTVATAAGREGCWLERVRSGLVALLGFFDDHPSWGRVLVLDAPVSVDVAFACKRRLHGVLARLLEWDEGAGSAEGSPVDGSSSLLPSALAGELLVGGVFAVIGRSMLGDDDGGGRLVELAPSLMAFVVAPYLGQAVARAELEGRPVGRGDAVVAGRGVAGRGVVRAQAWAISRAAELPVRATHRTTLVLRTIAGAPFLNNREIARAAGLADEGQTSKLLARLEGRGVIENVGIGAARGEPNAWILTPAGRRAIELIDESFAPDGLQPRRMRVRGTA
jgi:hypothetical protein